MPASEPASPIATPTERVWPARMLPGAVTARLATAVVAVTSRLSWKAASVTTAFVTARLPALRARTLPRARVAATVGCAKS